MAEADVTVTVKTIDQGSDKMRGYANNIRGIEGAASKVGSSLKGLAVGVGAVTGVMVAGGYAAKKFYDTIRQGAVLQTTTQRFDKLTASIGSTADAMLGQLRTATKGMIDDMSLMASASQIISLKLADNSDQVVRLATVVGTLGWDMQQVILTFANMSTMRLDALGLSVEEVKTKAAELEKAGMSAQEAFKEAVILAGEARLDVGGVSETEQQFKQLEAAIANVRNELSLAAVEFATSTGFTGWLGNLAKNIELNRQLEAAYRDGRISVEQYGIALDIAATEGKSAADGLAYLDRALETNTVRLYNQEGAWRAWAIGVQVNADEAARAVVAASTEIFRSLVGIQGGLDTITQQAGAGTYGGPMVLNDPWAARQAQRDANLAFVRHDSDFLQSGQLARAQMDYDRAPEAVGHSGGAVSMATQEELELAAAHERFMSAFNAELTGAPSAGLINEAGLVNVEAMNKALMEQAQAAGASATTLALLGVATGQFSEEQAEAALKAAVLQERIMQLAKGIASGEMSMGDALGNLAAFQQNIDQTGAGSLPETVSQLVDSIPADDRTVQFLTDTGLVKDDIRWLQSQDIEIKTHFGQPTNAPQTTVDSNRSAPLNKTGRTTVSVDMNLNFNGPANANDVGRGVRDGMASWARDLQREGVF